MRVSGTLVHLQLTVHVATQRVLRQHAFDRGLDHALRSTSDQLLEVDLFDEMCIRDRNYSDAGQEGPAQLFQFGLAAEDEAREVARRAWNDGMRRAVALVPRGDWGDRVLDAFRQSWQAQGGILIGAEHVDQPVELARQIADLFQLRESEARARRLQMCIRDRVRPLVGSRPVFTPMLIRN